MRWGAVAEVDATTTGSFLLDEFDSRRDTYIGALSVFHDVPLGHPLWRYVHSLYNGGVTSGCGGGAYCPNSSVTRDQMAVFLLRAREGSAYLPAACTTAPFGDVPVSSPYCRWIRELVSRSVTGGCGGGNYCPTSPATRAQMAVFLLLTKEGAGYTPPACTTAPFTDVPVEQPLLPLDPRAREPRHHVRLRQRPLLSGRGGEPRARWPCSWPRPSGWSIPLP